MCVQNLDRGIFVFSWDFELAWGYHDLPRLPERLLRYDSREYLERIIDILENYRVPSTWATVGHLLLDECTKIAGDPHSNLPSPSKEWYDSDPCSNVHEAPLWYAPDVINRLRSCKAKQEIGSHTFSHVKTDVGQEILEAELQACNDLGENGEMRTFISPRHGSVPGVVLKNAGFTNYRAPSKKPPTRQAIEFYTGIGGPETDIPIREPNGVWRHPVSTYFFYNPLHNVQRIRPKIKRRWFESGLQSSAEHGGVFHVWAHPHNFIGDEHALEQFQWLIRRVDQMRSNDQIRAMTMGQLTDYLENQR